MKLLYTIKRRSHEKISLVIGVVVDWIIRMQSLMRSTLSFLKRMKNDKRQVLDLEDDSSYNVHEGR